MENVKYRSECPKGAGSSLSLTPRLNQDLTPSGVYSTKRPVYDWMQFRNHTIQPSGEAAVAGYGLGRSFISRPWNRLLEKADEDRRGDLGG